jgi:Right handed beta helix region
VEFSTRDESALAYELIKLGADDRTQDSLDKVPHHLVLDRCYVHAFPAQSLKRGIALNSAETSVLNSYVAGFKVVGQEAQAVAGWNGPGPYHIVNNYLEAAGENILFGGAGPTLPGLVPTDIEVRRNHFAKDPAWFPKGRGFAGTHWSVKNLFELKNARRVVVDGNVFEYNWTDAQAGYSILFTPRPNDSGPAAVVEDVRFTNNVVRHVAAGIHIAGQDDLAQNPNARLLRRVRIANNLFDDVSGARWDGDGAFLKVGRSADGVTVDHNTVLHTGNITKAWGEPNAGFVFTNNLLSHNEYGVMGDGQSPGLRTIETYFPGAVFRGNVIAGADARLYPPGNFFPPALEAVRFAGAAAGDFRLTAASPFRGRATDGKDVGCDFAALEAASKDSSALPTPTQTPAATPTRPPASTRPRTVARPR